MLKFDSVFYYVTDLDRSIEFYTALLGVPPSSRDVVARFHLDGVLIELVPAADKAIAGGNGNARLTLLAEDFERAVRDLRNRGVPVSEVRRVANGCLATVTDPDGNEIVLWNGANVA